MGEFLLVSTIRSRRHSRMSSAAQRGKQWEQERACAKEYEN